jgi:hypothetical protein
MIRTTLTSSLEPANMRGNNSFQQTDIFSLTSVDSPEERPISNLNRQVFDKAKFNATIDTSFSQLGPSTPDLSFFDTNLATIEDFFTLYNKFFFEIPKEGITNSHKYLVIESGNYINFKQNSEEIQALLQEIAELRQENVDLRQENVNLIIQQST